MPPNIVDGLIIGVGAGLTTALILGAWRLFSRWRDRGEQISYIRDLVAKQAEAMLTANHLPPPPEVGGEPIHADFIRYAIFCRLQSDLEIAISSRTTALTYFG